MQTTQEEKEERKKKLKLQLIKQTTDMHVLETKQQYEEIKPAKLNTWMVDANGVHLTVKNPIGEFTATITTKDQGIPNLPKLVDQQFLMYVPKMPAEIYYKIERFFVDVCDKVNGAEAFVQIYYDRETGKYRCHVPKQTVTGTSVNYDKTQDLSYLEPDRYIFVMDIHSHNNMAAFFSGVDDRDETETRFYGVFGRVKQPIPDFRARYVVNEVRPEIKVEDIFDFRPGDNAKGYDYPKKWMEQIVNRKPLTQVVSRQTSFPTLAGNRKSYGPGSSGFEGFDDLDFLDQDWDNFGFPRTTKSYANTPVHRTNYAGTSYTIGGQASQKPTYKNWSTDLPEYLKDFIKEYKVSKGIPVVEEVKEIPKLLSGAKTAFEELSGSEDLEQIHDLSPEDFNTRQLKEAVDDLQYYKYKGPHERDEILIDLCNALTEEDIERIVENLCSTGQSDVIIKTLANENHLCLVDEEVNIATR